MKTLQDILYKAALLEVWGDLTTEVVDFSSDSREVVPGSLFVAYAGPAADGHQYIDKAIEKGAIAVVCEKMPADRNPDIIWVQVKNGKEALAFIAANFYDNPADKLEIVAVTGTNGKTTVTSVMHTLFTNMGHRSGLIGTVTILIDEEEVETKLTTPGPKQLHQTFQKMVQAGCTHCFMEVSSHALVQHRVAGVKFAAGVFTNITHDHLDYHGDFRSYLNAKKLLFDGLSSDAFALVNADDKNGKVMLQNCRARHKTFAINRMADYKARIVENTFEGLLLDMEGKEVWFRLIGSFNASNLLAAYGVAMEMGLDEEGVLLELSKIEGVSGRFETVYAPKRRITAIVDYAHTPDALKNVLQTIHDIRSGGGRVITVVGCGGNRDKNKRPVMAEIASRLSDTVILTSDNPRDEDPETIIDEMMAGVPISARRKVIIKENRAEAIRRACDLAVGNDIILVAGKGHETYQEIKGQRFDFDDRKMILENFKTPKN